MPRTEKAPKDPKSAPRRGFFSAGREFRRLQRRDVRWRAIPDEGQGEGLQHLTLRGVGDRIVADAVVIGSIGGRDFAAFVHVELSQAWETLDLEVKTTDGRGLVLQSDGAGHWRGGDGKPLPQFDSCIDIDLQGSPLTNTLPIRRLRIGSETGPVELEMVYVPFDTFEPYRFAQRYTCLEAAHRYLYENADGSFSAELTLDEDGLVIDYPALFERV